MPRRALSRILLSLLMLWQLSASVLAHPIMGLEGKSEQAVETSAEPCHEHLDGMDMSDMDMQQMDHADREPASSIHTDGCKAACKCPCAGTPALSFVLPTGVIVAPEAIAPPLFTSGFESPSLAHLLRPPI